jgi:hypothetical protein
MEIHAPRPAHSIREFFLELLTITVGIVIALSLEGVVQWAHHRQLVHEAEANLMIEIRDNRRELQSEFKNLRTAQEQLNKMLAAIHKVQANPSTSLGDLRFNWALATLHATSWNTAQATGALSFMDYPEVKRYTQLYDLQQQFMAVQERGFQSAMGVYAFAPLLDTPRKITDAQLIDAERAVGLALANTGAIHDIGEVLDKQYAEIPGRK